MNVAVYALVRDEGRRVMRRGVSGERLRVVRAGPVAAIVGDVPRAPAPTEPQLRAYASLIAALATRTQALLPVRFGTVMQDDAELQAVLRARQTAIRSQLSHIRGRAQMTVRIIATAKEERERRAAGRGATAPGQRPRKVPSSGSQYLAARAHEQRASSIPGFAPLSRAVARWVRDERVERRGNVATAYHLIPRAAAPQYAAVVQRVAALESLRVIVSGPWPAYAFADPW